MATLLPEDALTVQALEEFRGERLPTSGYTYQIERDLPYLGPDSSQGRLVRSLKSFNVGVTRCFRRRRVVSNVSPDIIHLQQLYFSTDWFDLRGLARRYPLVGVVHDVVPHDRKLPGIVENVLHRLLYQKGCTPHVIVHHASVRRILQERFGVDSKRIHDLPMAVMPIAKHQRRPDDGQRTVLFLGSLRANKGIAHLLEAIKMMGPYPGVKFIIAGEGSPEIEGKVRSAANSMPSLVAEIGFYSEERKRQLLSSADFLILPYTSQFTSQSAVLMDAYAYAVPVIATEVGGIGETVREEETGWLVRPDDSKALCETIIHALEDDAGYEIVREKIGSAIAKHHVNTVGQSLRDIYKSVISLS